MSRGLAASRTSSRTGSGSTEEVNVLGRTVRVRGRLTGEGDLRIEGEIEGDVKVAGALEIGDGGSVVGDVSASSVVLGGNLKGDVSSEGSVVIRAGSRVAGDVRGAEVALEEGASFTGRIEADFELPAGLLTGAGEASQGGKAARRGR